MMFGEIISQIFAKHKEIVEYLCFNNFFITYYTEIVFEFCKGSTLCELSYQTTAGSAGELKEKAANQEGMLS